MDTEAAQIQTMPLPTLGPSSPVNSDSCTAGSGLGLNRSDQVQVALADLERVLFLWHRMAMKGEIPGRLIAELGADLELPQFYALTAITRIQNGVGRAASEPATIGLLAEEMNLDPSRASRIAAGLIAQCYAAREAAQEDGRKTVLVLTDKGRDMLARLRELRQAKLIGIFADWSDEDIAAFAKLFRRYVDGVVRSRRSKP